MNDRQQQLISLLCQRRSDSIQNLAMELGVCERRFAGILKNSHLLTQSRLSVADMAVGSGWQDWYFQDRPKLTPKQTALLKRLAIGLHGEDLDEMNRILTHFAS